MLDKYVLYCNLSAKGEFLMIQDPIDVVWCFVGILVWPGLTLCIILWSLGHPILGIIALISVESTTKVRTILKERVVSTDGTVLKETETITEKEK
jgi:hypothetical protein